jgi:hypothetical protein
MRSALSAVMLQSLLTCTYKHWVIHLHWLIVDDAKKLQNERWSTCSKEMREKKGKVEWSKFTEELGRKE